MSGNINDTDATKVLREITAMRKELDRGKGKDRNYYHEKYSYLATFPYLLDKVYSGMSDSDMNKLHTMIIGVSNIQHNKISLDDASVKMGESLAEEYVYPVIGRPERQVSLAEAKARLNVATAGGRPEGTIPLSEYLKQENRDEGSGESNTNSTNYDDGND